MANVLILEDREIHTIIAALRYWQREGLHSSGHEHDLAGNGGEVDALSGEEIDRLIEGRINSAGLADRCEAISVAREVLSEFGDDPLISDLDDELYYGLEEAAREDDKTEVYDIDNGEYAEDEED